MANLDDELREAVQAYDEIAGTKAGSGNDSTTEPRSGGSVWLLRCPALP